MEYRLIIDPFHNLNNNVMSKKSNHNSDIKNPNKGTDGTNKTHDKNQGNRGKQSNPNQTTKQIGKKK